MNLPRIRLACLIACWALASAVRGAEPQPIAVLSCASLDDLRADLDVLGQSIRSPGFSVAVARALSRTARVERLEGMDPRRRWGLVVDSDGLAVVPVVLIPVSDADRLLAAMVPLLGGTEPAEDGLVRIGRPPLTGYVRVRDGWAYAAQSPGDLDTLPSPEWLQSGLDAECDVLLTLHVQRIPEAYRTMAVDYLGTTLEQSRAPSGGPPWPGRWPTAWMPRRTHC